jgi:hypothetical protein
MAYAKLLLITQQSQLIAASTRNVVFHKAALELAIRAPAMPAGGDAAVDAMTIQDPYSGLVFGKCVLTKASKKQCLTYQQHGVLNFRNQSLQQYC